MIPTMLLFGLVAGRWWRQALIVAAIVWPLLILAVGTLDTTGDFVAASIVGVANAAVGVLIHQGVLRAYRKWA